MQRDTIIAWHYALLAGLVLFWPQTILAACAATSILPKDQALSTGKSAVSIPEKFTAQDELYEALAPAINRNHKRTVAALLADTSADLNYMPPGKMHLINLAAVLEDPTLLLLLLEHDADPEQACTKENSPLHVAAGYQRLDTLQLLLALGLNPNMQAYNDTTPLHEAVDHSFLAGVVLLLLADANPNTLNKFSQTPLYRAVQLHNQFKDNASKRMCMRSIIELLLLAGSDPDVHDDKSNTPHTIAKDSALKARLATRTSTPSDTAQLHALITASSILDDQPEIKALLDAPKVPEKYAALVTKLCPPATKERRDSADSATRSTSTTPT